MPPPDPDPQPQRAQFVIGLAGHIDHGKSALVQALTGSKTDRLPEEQRRGITIDLGFAHFDAEGRRFALIDVPGHERFIHTMVAGASGVDAALLVVAADDSVMPQTREHLALLELLGVRRGVIAISKCDLANEELLELVEMETAELVATTFLAGAPRIRVSAQAGTGIEELQQALIGAALSSEPRAANDPRFRLPIDRAFSPAGQGAVVTGTVWGGTARVGETLHLLPAGEPVRVRRLQSQGKDVESVSAGERAAINLVGIKAAAIHRGDELATPQAFEPGRRLLVQLQMLGDAKQPLKHRQLVRLHLGANQTTAQVLMDQREVLPGQNTFALLRTAAPVVAEFGQPFVLRQLSPAATIGGGKILAPALRPTDKLKRCLAAAAGLAAADPAIRLGAYVELRRETSGCEQCETRLGFSAAECQAALDQLIKKKELIAAAGPQPSYVTAKRFAQLKQKLLQRCREELERRRPASQMPVTSLLAAMSRYASEGVLQQLLDDMVASRELIRRGDRVGLPSGAELSQRQRQLLTTLLRDFATAGRAPPTLKELAEQHKLPQRDLEQLVQVAVDDGQLIKLSPLMAIDREALDGLRQSLSDYFQRQPTAKVGELREQWGITRKHAVPIFEFFDESRVTLRKDDLRTAGPKLTIPIGEATT
jgi:selenocysteine-specific elongation factor